MTDFLCKLTLKKLYDNHIINEEDMEVYEYGLTLLIGTIGKIIGFIIFGILTGLLKEIFIFIIFFSGLRLQAGGYHAKTVLSCFLGSLAAINFSIFFVKILPVNYQPVFNIFSIIISVLLVFLFSPSESENKPLTEKEKVLYRQRSIVTVILGSIIILFLAIKGDIFLYFASIASMGFLLESITLVSFKKWRQINKGFDKTINME